MKVLRLIPCLFKGTAANARDVASMVDAIEGPGSEINYWYLFDTFKPDLF
jgi:hypothetical protein